MSRIAEEQSYAEWKRWHSTSAFAFGRKDAKYFRGELRGLNIKGAHVLEIGFGNGMFLAWAADEGARVRGTELNGHSVALGRERGFDVHLGPVDEIPSLQGERFDLIVLIDVLEHLADDDLGRTLHWIAAHLADDGRCIARFPNGASPFGLGIQHGDVTHRQILTEEKLRQLSFVHGFEIVKYRNQYRSWATGLPAIRQFAQRVLRSLTERYIRFILESRHGPLDMNAVAVLRRRPGGDRS